MNWSKFGPLSKAYLGFTLLWSSSMLLPTPALAASTLPPGTGNDFSYVAFGDSLTTGSSVATCKENRQRSPWGCQEQPTAATPYPDRIAQQLGFKYNDKPAFYKSYDSVAKLDMYRAGIWGYSVQEAAQAQDSGTKPKVQPTWLPQLQAVQQAKQLVTGSLGINDLHFSDVKKWASLYVRPGDDHVAKEAQAIIAAHSGDFDQLFESLQQAKANGATVVVTMYYSPYSSGQKDCDDLENISNTLVDTLDDELMSRAHHAGFDVADFRRSFQGHGSGSKQPFVFGTQCKLSSAIADWAPTWLGGGGGKFSLGVGFDPHPNNAGTTAMANAIIGEFNNAD